MTFPRLQKSLKSYIKENDFSGINDIINEFCEGFTNNILDSNLADFYTKSLLPDIYQIPNCALKIKSFLVLSKLFIFKGEGLIHAMEYQQNDILEYYIKNENLNITNKEIISPLIWAVIKQNKELVQQLVDCGADVNILGAYGNNAIQYAIDKDDAEMTKLLIQNKINFLGHTNEIHDSCLARAIRGQAKEITSLLMTYPETLFLDNEYSKNNEDFENPLQRALKELTYNQPPEPSLACMVCIQFAIRFPEYINEFKTYEGYDIIKIEVGDILDNIALENKLQQNLTSTKNIKHTKI
jgi:Ankyrin repeats (3 copies)